MLSLCRPPALLRRTNLLKQVVQKSSLVAPAAHIASSDSHGGVAQRLAIVGVATLFGSCLADCTNKSEARTHAHSHLSRNSTPTLDHTFPSFGSLCAGGEGRCERAVVRGAADRKGVRATEANRRDRPRAGGADQTDRKGLRGTELIAQQSSRRFRLRLPATVADAT